MISTRIVQMRDAVRRGDYRTMRQAAAPDVRSECDRLNLSWPRLVARLVTRQCEAEKVVIGEDECIVFTRTIPAVPKVYSDAEEQSLFEGYAMHEAGAYIIIPAHQLSPRWRSAGVPNDELRRKGYLLT